MKYIITLIAVFSTLNAYTPERKYYEEGTCKYLQAEINDGYYYLSIKNTEQYLPELEELFSQDKKWKKTIKDNYAKMVDKGCEIKGSPKNTEQKLNQRSYSLYCKEGERGNIKNNKRKKKCKSHLYYLHVAATVYKSDLDAYRSGDRMHRYFPSDARLRETLSNYKESNCNAYVEPKKRKKLERLLFQIGD